MRGIPKILLTAGLLVLSLWMLAGCGRRKLQQDSSASGIVVFQLEKQKSQTSQLTPTPVQSATGATNPPAAPAAPAATPQPAGKTATKTAAPDADIDGLMDELETTLNELEASITAADKDTLTDSALVALGK